VNPTAISVALWMILWWAPAAAPTFTFITQEKLADGSWLVEPIHTPTFRLEPLNAVAAGTRQGEALNCTGEVVGYGTPDAHAVFHCEGADFELRGVRFQE